MIIKLKFDQETVDRLSRIRQRMEIKDNMEVVRRALAVYDAITENMVDKDGKVYIHFPDGVSELVVK